MTPSKGVIFLLLIFQKPLDKIIIKYYNMNVRLKEIIKERGNYHEP